MLRQLIALILISSTLAVPCVGQRGGGAMHGFGMPRSGHGPGFRIVAGFPNAPFFGNFGFRHFHNFGWNGAGWIPWAYPWYGADWAYPWNSPRTSASYAGSAQNGSAPVVIIERSGPVAAAPPPEPPKIIEVPTGKDPPSSQPGSPTVFVLANGERLEARRYMLTVDSLDIEVGQQHRRVPMSELNIQQTLAANHERGIEVKIPDNSSEVFLSF